MSGTGGKTLLIGCGGLRKELELLRNRNSWEMETRFLDSFLHVDLELLYRELEAALALPAERTEVCFGVCHPRIKDLLVSATILSIEDNEQKQKGGACSAC